MLYLHTGRVFASGTFCFGHTSGLYTVFFVWEKGRVSFATRFFGVRHERLSYEAGDLAEKVRLLR